MSSKHYCLNTIHREDTMTKEKADRLKAANCGLSVKEYQRRMDELLRQVEIIKEVQCK
jgi:hypothetical protein